nr:9492_t:CDS:2 [Entrophospora candida]
MGNQFLMNDGTYSEYFILNIRESRCVTKRLKNTWHILSTADCKSYCD